MVGMPEIRDWMSQRPDAGGPRTLFLRIPLTSVTGRQVMAT
jgi:hypothetical protein